MKHPVRRFKSLATALKELEPSFRNGEAIRTGRGFEEFHDMRPREAMANLLVCIVLNAGANEGPFTFTSDPTGGDGIILNTVTGETWRTEHVMAGPYDTEDMEARVLRAIADKCSNGEAYAAGKTLIVFPEGAGAPWFPNRVAKQLPTPFHFDGVWAVGLQRVEEDGAYLYAVAHLDVGKGDAPVVTIRINPTFDGWSVERTQ